MKEKDKKRYDIIYTPDYELVVDSEAEILKGNPVVSTYNGNPELVFCETEKQASWFQGGYGQKIIAHTPLNGAKQLDGVYLLPPEKDNLNIQCDYSDEKLFEEAYNYRQKRLPNLDGIAGASVTEAYYDGYKAAGGFTEEDMRKCFEAGMNYGVESKYEDAPDFSEYIQSLKPKAIAFQPYEKLVGRTGKGDEVEFTYKIINNILQGKRIYK